MSKSRVSYEQKMRDRAKAEGKTLVTIDVNGSEYRTTLQGPMNGEKLRIAQRALWLLTGLSEEQIAEIWADEDAKTQQEARP